MLRPAVIRTGRGNSLKGEQMDKLKETRKRYGYQEKRLILEEHFNSGLSLSAISRKYQVHPVTLYNWKRSLCCCLSYSNNFAILLWRFLCIHHAAKVDARFCRTLSAQMVNSRNAVRFSTRNFCSSRGRSLLGDWKNLYISELLDDCRHFACPKDFQMV